MNGLIDKSSKASAGKSQAMYYEESEENLLRKKVQIKTQALVMLSQELDQCRMQRDRYKLMSEQLQEDLTRRKQDTQTALDEKMINGYESQIDSTNRLQTQPSKMANLERDTKLMDLLIENREQNKCLRLQVDTLKQKLKEAQEDIKALRSQKAQKLVSNEETIAIHQKEELLGQLEKLNVKYRQLKLDLQSLLDEKQELEQERDAFKCKAHRLNHELSQALSASKPVDVDALINENRYLHERLQQLLEEKELTQQSVQKYKSMLDSKRQKGTIKLGVKSSVGSVMTFKQVEELLQQGPNIPPQKAADALFELHSICTALLESLNDKNLALAHQKKANKILAARMCELDKIIQSPTLKLLEGYSNSDVDIRSSTGDVTSTTSDLSEERSEDKESDVQIDAGSAESNVKSKQSETSSAGQSILCIEHDESCNEQNVEIKSVNKNFVMEEEEKSKKYESGPVEDFDFEKLDFTKSYKAYLPESLSLVVEQYLEELKAKDQNYP